MPKQYKIKLNLKANTKTELKDKLTSFLEEVNIATGITIEDLYRTHLSKEVINII